MPQSPILCSQGIAHGFTGFIIHRPHGAREFFVTTDEVVQRYIGLGSVGVFLGPKTNAAGQNI